MAVKRIPEGYHTVTPYLTARGVDRLIDFLKQAFGAEERERFLRPDGAILHAEVKIGDSIVMLGEASEQWPARPTSLYIYVEDADNVYRRALQYGATSVMEPADQFYGDRNAGITDPAGNAWWIATHIEDVSREEMEKRARAYAQKVA
ncbi:MAG: VOC family protein [Terriglobales bacterium]